MCGLCNEDYTKVSFSRRIDYGTDAFKDFVDIMVVTFTVSKCGANVTDQQFINLVLFCSDNSM